MGDTDADRDYWRGGGVRTPEGGRGDAVRPPDTPGDTPPYDGSRRREVAKEHANCAQPQDLAFAQLARAFVR